jgi:hypothetical protein
LKDSTTSRSAIFLKRISWKKLQDNQSYIKIPEATPREFLFIYLVL